MTEFADEFNEIVTLLQEPQYILFVCLDTDESCLHDQSKRKIVIPPIDSRIFIASSGNEYKVESITFDCQDLIVRLTKE